MGYNNGPGPSPICKVYEASQLALGTWPACGIYTSETKTFTGEAAKMHGELGKLGPFFVATMGILQEALDGWCSKFVGPCFKKCL